MKIGVVYGGTSSERAVSIGSGKRVYEALLTLGYTDAFLIDFDGSFVYEFASYKMDVAFLAIQGTLAEDGCLQGIMECAGVPYTHSDVLTSALCMDKHLSSVILSSAGIPIPEYKIFRPRKVSIPKNLLDAPYVLKPVREGSSYGITLVENPENPGELNPELLHRNMMASRYIDGQELTVGVLGDKALGVLEVTGFHGLYDYEDKHKNNAVDFLYPARVPEEIKELAMTYAELAHKTLGCLCISRTDFRYNATDGLYVLEINSNPGLSHKSMFPKLAEYRGIDFPSLVSTILEEALSRKASHA